MQHEKRRRFPWAALLAVGLLANAGCLTGGPWPWSDRSGPENATPRSKSELPPAQSTQLNLTLAERFEKEGRDAEAALYYEKARQTDPKLEYLSSRLAAVYDRLGDTKHAQQEFQRALKAHPRDANLINNYGYFFYSRGQWKEAEAEFQKALVINANHQRAWVNLGLTLGQQGRYAESLDAFVKVVSRAEGLSNLAFIYTTQGKKEEARSSYREALNLDPNLRIARLALQRLEHPTGPVAAASASSAAATAPGSISGAVPPLLK